MKLIPLTGKNGVDENGNKLFAKVSDEDYDEISKFKWYVSSGYPVSTIRINGISKNYTLHLYLLRNEKIKDENKDKVINHINGNRLDNTRENLEITSRRNNSQNRIKKENCSSKYIGVSLDKTKKKWQSQSDGKILGSFENEIDAAKAYDYYVRKVFGETANNNNTTMSEEELNKTKFDKLKNSIENKKKPKKIERNLPTNIKKCFDKFHVIITINKKKFNSSHKTLEEAVKSLEKIKKKNIIQEEIKNKNVLLTFKNEEIIINSDKFDELNKYKWSVCEKDGYARGYVNGRKTYIHRFIMNCKVGDGKIIDHINGNRLDNRIENLRETTSSQNSQNRKSVNEYKGVRLNGYNWSSIIKKNGKKFHLGTFTTKIEAAIVYNNKARELHGVHGTFVNKFSEELLKDEKLSEELKEKIKKEIDFQKLILNKKNVD